MKTLTALLDRFSLLNGGNDIRNRSTAVKVIVVLGMFLVIGLAIFGAIQIANS
jgi:hypothetical protein